MKKLLNNPWIVGALALAALGFVAHSLIPASSGGSVSAVTEDPGAYQLASDTPVETAVDAEGVREALKELSETSTARDPFSPRNKLVAQSPVLVEKTPAPDLVETVKLTALWTQDGATYALINNRVCTAGEKLGRITLEKATHDGVWVTHWKGRDFLTLGTAFTLTTPALKAASLSLSTDS